MQDYLYDGTFEGFLTCVYHHYYTEPAAGICLKKKNTSLHCWAVSGSPHGS